MMTKLICECCGAPINRMRQKCEYCGTEYRFDREDVPIRIETYQNPVNVYESQMAIPRHVIEENPDEISKYAVNVLASNLAEAIKENMQLQRHYNPEMDAEIITAKARIVRPEYRF